MPELPEVETVMRGLEPAMAGARFARVEQRRPNLRFPLPERFVDRLEGKSLDRLTWRAKYILAHLSSVEVLVVHLGMTGRFTVEMPKKGGEQVGEFHHAAGGDPVHDHVVFHMESSNGETGKGNKGARITYNDARRFGYMDLVASDGLEASPHFKNLGIEPLSNALNSTFLAERAAGRSADLKAFLMDQRHIAGLGNIYVCEALFRSGLSPKRAASCLADRKARPTERAERLVPVIRTVLDEAIVAGGSTLRDYRNADGALGYFQHRFAVYDREGEPCPRPTCKATIKRIVQSGRSTFYCPACQR
jgi:formamidopyrimidine-DNA glycosylase